MTEETRLDRIERIVERNVIQIEKNSRDISTLQQEMREFKEAMTEYVVKNEQALVDILRAIEANGAKIEALRKETA